MQFDFPVTQGESLCRGLRSRLGGSRCAPEGNILLSTIHTRPTDSQSMDNPASVGRRAHARVRVRTHDRASTVSMCRVTATLSSHLLSSTSSRICARRRVLRDASQQVEVGLLRIYLFSFALLVLFFSRAFQSVFFFCFFIFIPFMDRDESPRRSRRDHLDFSAVCNVTRVA